MDCQNTHIMVTDDNHQVRRGKSWVIHSIWPARSSCETFCANSALLLVDVFPCLSCSYCSPSVFLPSILPRGTCFSEMSVLFILIHQGKQFLLDFVNFFTCIRAHLASTKQIYHCWINLVLHERRTTYSSNM